MTALDVRGSRLVALWYPKARRRHLVFEVYIGLDGTLQLNLGRLHLGHYRRPW